MLPVRAVDLPIGYATGPSARASNVALSVRTSAAPLLIFLLFTLTVLPGCWYGPMLADPNMPWPPPPGTAPAWTDGAYYDPPPGAILPPTAPAVLEPEPSLSTAAPAPGQLAPAPDAEKARQARRRAESRHTGPPLTALQGYEPRILHWQSWNDEPPFLPVPTAPVFQVADTRPLPETDARAPTPRQAAPSTGQPAEPLPPPLPMSQQERRAPRAVHDDQYDDHNHDHTNGPPGADSSLPEMAPPEPDSTGPSSAPDAGVPDPHPPQPDAQPSGPPLATATENATQPAAPRTEASADTQTAPLDAGASEQNGSQAIPPPETIRLAPPAASGDRPGDAPNGRPTSKPSDNLDDVAGDQADQSPRHRSAAADRPHAPSATEPVRGSSGEGPQHVSRRPSRRRASLGWRPYRPGRSKSSPPRLPIASRPPDVSGP